MGIKWELTSPDFSQWSKEKSYLGPKLAYCKYKKVLEWFLHFLVQILSQLGD